MPYVGSSVPGLLDAQLVAGRGQYTADVSLPEMGYMAVVRSPYAHARIVSINVREAVNHPKVRRVVTGEDSKKLTDPIPHAIDPRAFGGKGTEVYCLALDYVRYVGEPVAALVADDKYAAAEALDLLQVEYEELPVVVDAEKALAATTPLLYPEWETNEMLHVHFQGGNVEQAFAEADYVLEDTVRVHRHTGAPIEPRAYVAAYDRRDGSLTLWASTQNPHPLRTTLAQTLRLQEGNIRVIQPQVGGGFGLKTPPFQEEPLICLLAMLTGKPVKWIEERNEHLLACGHAREQVHHFAVAFRQDGKVIGLKDRIVADVGVLSTLVGWGMAFVTSFTIPGPYKIPHCEVDLSIVVTNKCPWNAYRGFGKENAAFLMDRVMDRVAAHLGMDRAEVRGKNFVSPEEFPHTQISGATLDSGNYAEALQAALSKAGYESFAEEQQKLRDQSKYLGIGVSFELTPEGGCIPDSLFSGYDTATVRVSPTGQVTVLTGVTSPGSGNETAIAQIVADELGVKLEDIKVIQGDTTTCPYGLGNYSSRSILIGGSAALTAAREVRYKVVRVAASMLATPPEELEREQGHIRVKGKPEKEVAFNEVARYIYRRAYDSHALDMEPGLESTRYFRMPNIHHLPDQYGRINAYPSYPYAACVAIVEVDPETGVVTPLRYVAVHDCGVMINPLLVEGQFHGGVAQGLGGVLYEQLSYDENGQLLTGTFMDYTLPTAVEIPPMELYHQVTPSPFTPLGTKGAGESGISGPFGAIVSAVEDALSPFAIKIRETPLTPQRVWRLIQEAKAAKEAKEKSNP